MSAELAEPTWDDLSALKIVEVPDVWPPLAQDAAASRHLEKQYSDTPCSDTPRSNAPRPEQADAAGQPWPRQFAVALAEALAGVRPLQQILPWMSRRGGIHLHRLRPLFRNGHRPRVLRVLTATPSRDVIELTVIVATGPRTRALAVRLERAGRPTGQGKLTPRWLCTDIESA
jgi:hypothetical protein